jgi:putative transposase
VKSLHAKIGELRRSAHQGRFAERKAKIDRAHDLPIAKQAEALNISRGSVYNLPRPVSETDLAIMRRIDRLHLECPFAGSRMLRGLLAGEGCKIGRRHVKTLMRRMGIEALYRRPALPRYGRTAALSSFRRAEQDVLAGYPRVQPFLLCIHKSAIVA